MRVRSILAPTDFSVHAQTAVARAAELAQQFGASLRLMHAYHLPALTLPDGVVFPTPRLVADLSAQYQAQLEEGAAKLRDAYGVEVSVELRQGLAADEVIESAKAAQDDLVVLATHGRSGVSHFLLGSVSERVVRGCPVPVMTLRAERDA